MITPEAMAKLDENMAQIIEILKKIDNHIDRVAVTCGVVSTILDEMIENVAEKIGAVETIKQYFYERGLPKRIMSEIIKQEAEQNEK